MLKKEVVYEDFDGETQTKVLHFNLTKAELSRMIMDEMTFGENEDDEPVNGLSERINNVIARRSGKELMEMFDWLIEKSYGVREGERFVKSEELFEEFTQTAAYDAFYMELLTDTDAMIEFVNGVMPKDVAERMKDDPEFQRHTKELRDRTE